jgi:hypothetical protein
VPAPSQATSDAKPVARAVAWSAVCVAVAGLVAGARRNLQGR